jgi:HK97 family phage portal protein
VGVVDRLRSRATREKAAAELPSGVPQIGPPPGGGPPRATEAVAWALSLTPAKVWRSQPYVRTVVTFLARNVAQLGVHAFRRIEEDQRERLRDHPVAQLFSRPNDSTTCYELIYGLIADLALYDRAYWALGRSRATGRDQVVRIPPARIQEHVAVDPIAGVQAFRMVDVQGTITDLPAERVLYFPGWNPTDPLGLPSSPLESLKNVIAEQAAAFEFRKLNWDNGAQMQGTINRPMDAPAWSEAARNRFMDDVRAQFGPNGPRRGGMMLLEDGMTASSQQFNAREAQWIDAAKLSLAIVASVYHVNPTMVGLLDNANYSNVREFRRMLYGDTLGPTLAQVEDRVNAFLVPLFDDSDGVYVEFNLAEKLQGSFEEQAAAFQAAVGAPWMLRSEARSRLNLPPIDDADELVVPLNVLIGGQASPVDSAPPGNGPPARPSEFAGPAPRVKAKVKARRDPKHEDQAATVLRGFFRRQAASVLPALGAKADQWWDGERWDRELGDDLYRLAVDVSRDVASSVLQSIGFGPDAYDVDRTREFLTALSARVASSVNAVTKSQLDTALGGDDPAAAVRNVFDIAEDSRTAQAATTAVTAVSGFATTESAKQAAGDTATKTWIVTSTNPRPTHARMDGETVGIEDSFSNGAAWPGDAVLGADETAGCTCEVEITVE